MSFDKLSTKLRNDHHHKLAMLPSRLDTRQNPIHLPVMGEGVKHLVNNPIRSDSARDELDFQRRRIVLVGPAGEMLTHLFTAEPTDAYSMSKIKNGL